ncbi:MAG: type II toxin-antitoxin system VapC family toxin [Alphaproteobacteria bacterium]|nr:type II toxin-antitoxin system VapC family toxin [Alphaproteobacteria bacterium]
MSVLVDTNVLLRGIDPGDADHQLALDAVATLLGRDEPVFITLQVLTEVWRVMTGPKGRNGLGFPVALADAELSRVERLFAVLPEDAPAIAVEWRRLVVRHQVVDLDTFDARLAATIVVHQLDHILTFDTGFTRYGISVLHPSAVSP